MTQLKTVLSTSCVGAVLCAGTAMAQTTWDMTSPWPATNFHAANAVAFADAVREATDGSVDITVHLSGELGVGITESLTAVETGIVQMSDTLVFLQSGVEPLLSVDTLPYLIQGQDEMRAWLEVAGPAYDEILARHNQMVLYYVPWPSPGVYTTSAIVGAEDMAGQRIRAFNATSFEFLERMGAAPLEMPWGDVAPALAAGTIDGVATSSSSGVDGQLWQFTENFNPLNWSTSLEAVTVNLDAWTALTPEEQNIIQSIADEMEAEFWAISAAEDADNVAILIENGITVSEADESLVTRMAEAGRDMWASYLDDVPEAQPLIDAYTASVNK